MSQYEQNFKANYSQEKLRKSPDWRSLGAEKVQYLYEISQGSKQNESIFAIVWRRNEWKGEKIVCCKNIEGIGKATVLWIKLGTFQEWRSDLHRG